MRIHLVRHAPAIERAMAPYSDGERQLSADGRQRMRRAARKLARFAAFKLGRVFTSPLVRAVQTAEILANAADYEGEIEVWSVLRPEEPATAPLEALDAIADADVVTLVGHEPQLSQLASRLLGAPFPLRFVKGAVASLERKKGVTTLRWFYLPKDRRFVGFDGLPVRRVR